MNLSADLIKHAPDANLQGITNGQTLIWNSVTMKFDAGTISSSNFSNDDLVFDAPHSHNLDGHTLDISSDNGVYAKSWLSMYETANEYGWGNQWTKHEATGIRFITGGSTKMQVNASTGFIGIGTVSPAARLDIHAQGALSTDIALRVRNSANTINTFAVLGNGDIDVRTNRVSAAQSRRISLGGNNTDNAVDSGAYDEITIVGYNNTNAVSRATIIGSSNTFNAGSSSPIVVVGYGNTSIVGGSMIFGKSNSGSASLMVGSNNTASGSNAVVVGFNNIVSEHAGYPILPMLLIGIGVSIPNNIATNNCVFISAGANSTAPFNTFKNDNLLIGSLTPWTSNFDNNSRGVFYTKNGIAPTTLAADSIAMYSADIVAGNAAPHFRTENGSIIKLFTGAALTASDATLANAVIRIAELEARLQANGLIF